MKITIETMITWSIIGFQMILILLMLKMNTNFLKEINKLSNKETAVKKVGDKVKSPLVSDKEHPINFKGDLHIIFVKNGCEVCSNIINHLKTHTIHDLYLISNSLLNYDIPNYSVVVSPELIYDVGIEQTPTYIHIGQDREIKHLQKLTSFEELISLIDRKSVAS